MGLILNRRREMGGKLLPYDAEIKYLESTGTQWINTLYKPNNNTRVICDFQYTESNSYPRIFGCSSGTQWNSAPSFQLNFESGVTTGKLGVVIGNNTAWSRVDIAGDFNRHSYDLTTTRLIYDGTQVATYSDQTFQCTTNLAIFARLDANNAVSASESASGKLYSFQIYENDELVRDFIPVRIGTVGYLYDKVSGELFGNAGADNFVLGPDVYPPYDAEIEYIESSTGTEVIDTGVIPNESTKVQFRFTNIEVTGAIIIGYYCGDDTKDWRFFNHQNQAYFDTYDGSGNVGKRIKGGSIISNTLYNLEMGNYYIKDLETGENIISGDVYTGIGTNTIYINGNNGHSSKNRWYYIKIYDGTTLVRDFIPVRVGNVGYLYDKVSRQLFGNDGTGSFVLGPDLVYHWSGEDSLSGGSWVDRVNGKIWSASGNTPTKGTNYYEVGSVPDAFFTMNMNSQGLNLGTYYDIAITFEVLTVGSAVYGNYILDLGSLVTANKAFGIGFSNDTSTLWDNWKGLGNNSTQYGASDASTVPLNQKVTIIYGCKKYSDTQDVQYFINGGATYQSAQPHSPSVDFNGTDWSNATGLIGDGVVRAGKCGKIRIYEIKMYRQSTEI